MAAACYWCKTNTAPGKVPSPVGLRGEPIGCCQYCHVFSCGEHAIRDKFQQHFKCYDCLFIKLAASATAKVDISVSDKQTLINWDKIWKVVFSFLENKNDIYIDINEFITNNPQLNRWFDEILSESINYDLWPYQVQYILNKFTDDSEKFLIASARLISSIEDSDKISESDTPLKYYLFHIINNTMLG